MSSRTSMTERITASVTEVRTHLQRLVQLNIELVKAEIAQRGRLFATALGLFAAAAVLALYGLGFLLTTIAVALSLALPLWLSLLIVAVALFVVVAIMVWIGRKRLDRAQGPGAQQAIASAQATAQQLGRHLGKTASAADPRGKRQSAVADTPSATAPAATAPAATAPVATATAPRRPVPGERPAEGERP
jgi:membrane protein implicated in regulation of membrane protease activity